MADNFDSQAATDCSRWGQGKGSGFSDSTAVQGRPVKVDGQAIGSLGRRRVNPTLPWALNQCLTYAQFARVRLALCSNERWQLYDSAHRLDTRTATKCSGIRPPSLSSHLWYCRRHQADDVGEVRKTHLANGGAANAGRHGRLDEQQRRDSGS